MPIVRGRAPSQGPLRCAIYTRQSVRSESDLTSCEVQRDLCCQLLRAQHPDLLALDEHFDDEGVSGATLDRPAFQRFLQRVRAGEVDAVVVHRLDRLARRVLDCAKLLGELRDRGVRLFIAAMPEIGAGAFDMFLLNLLSTFAEFERELITSRIRDARAALIKRGRRIAGVVPFGYVADPITKQLRPVPAEAGVVRQLFEWAAGGKRPSEIAQLAGERQWRTRRGSPWTPRQVVETLSNLVYTGRLGSAASPREGCHEAILSPELFEKARGAVEARRTRPPGRRPGVAASFLQGRVRCAACGRLMSVHSNRRGCVEHRYFRCTDSGGLPRCQGTHVRVATLESEVLSIFVEPERRIKRGRGRPDRFMTTLFAFAQIFPTLSLAARDEFAREVIEEVVWDAGACRARIRLNPPALRRRYQEQPFYRAAVLFAEAFCKHLGILLEPKHLA
jgi:DNA invertase Pin-like site-specific DNA recombinase